jgi:hypothetical protein
MVGLSHATNVKQITMGVDSDRNTEREEEIKRGERGGGEEERRDQQFTTVHISLAIGAHKSFI